GGGVADLVPEHLVLAPSHRAPDRLRVWVHDDLVRIETMTSLRVVRAIYAVPIELAGPDVGHVAVPHHVGLLGQRDAMRFARRRRRIEKAELDLGGVRGEQGEVEPEPGPGA